MEAHISAMLSVEGTLISRE